MVSAAFRGADTHQLRALAQAFRAATDRLTGMSGATTRALAQTQWYGSDAELFRSDWSAHLRPRIAAVAAAMADAGTALIGQAEQQDAASVADWPAGGAAGLASAGSAAAPGASSPSGAGAASPGTANSGTASPGTANSGTASPGTASPGTGADGASHGVGPNAAGGSSAVHDAWDTWSAWYGRLAAAHGLLPYVATAVKWPDAPRLGPKSWTDIAEGWSRLHLPTAALGRTMGALDLAAVASDGVQTVAAIHDGDGFGALEHGIPAAFGAMAAAPIPVVRLVGLAGGAGWTVGSWIQAPINNSAAGIWMGDHVVGPAGDALVGAWDWLSRQASGAVSR